MLKYTAPYVFLPRPHRSYPWFKSYRKRLSIDIETVNEILSEYDLYLIEKPISTTSGSRNISLIVNTIRGKGILKSYTESLGSSTIIQEHSILKYLAQIDFPATRLVETKSTQTLVIRGKHRYALFDYVDGGYRSCDYIAFPKQTSRYIAIAGRMLAALHSKLADFTPQGYNPDGFKSKTGDRWRDTGWFANKLTFNVNKTLLRNEDRRKHKYALLLQNAEKLETALFDYTSTLNSADLPRQVIHKDYGPGHLLFRKNMSPVIIDFEIARFDWRIVDIIDGFQSFCKSWKGYFCHDKIKAFLSNYQAKVHLTSTELEYLPSVWKLMQVWSCILDWHKHFSIGDTGLLDSACQKLKYIDWISENQDTIKTTLIMSIE